jgi:hypothetical protein
LTKRANAVEAVEIYSIEVEEEDDQPSDEARFGDFQSMDVSMDQQDVQISRQDREDSFQPEDLMYNDSVVMEDDALNALFDEVETIRNFEQPLNTKNPGSVISTHANSDNSESTYVEAISVEDISSLKLIWDWIKKLDWSETWGIILFLFLTFAAAIILAVIYLIKYVGSTWDIIQPSLVIIFAVSLMQISLLCKKYLRTQRRRRCLRKPPTVPERMKRAINRVTHGKIPENIVPRKPKKVQVMENFEIRRRGNGPRSKMTYIQGVNRHTVSEVRVIIQQNSAGKRPYLKIHLQGDNFAYHALCDGGSQVNCIPLEVLVELETRTKMQISRVASNINLFGFANSLIKTAGFCIMNVEFENGHILENQVFAITESISKSVILGAPILTNYRFENTWVGEACYMGVTGSTRPPNEVYLATNASHLIASVCEVSFAPKQQMLMEMNFATAPGITVSNFLDKDLYVETSEEWSDYHIEIEGVVTAKKKGSIIVMGRNTSDENVTLLPGSRCARVSVISADTPEIAVIDLHPAFEAAKHVNRGSAQVIKDCPCQMKESTDAWAIFCNQQNLSGLGGRFEYHHAFTGMDAPSTSTISRRTGSEKGIHFIFPHRLFNMSTLRWAHFNQVRKNLGINFGDTITVLYDRPEMMNFQVMQIINAYKRHFQVNIRFLSKGGRICGNCLQNRFQYQLPISQANLIHTCNVFIPTSRVKLNEFWTTKSEKSPMYSFMVAEFQILGFMTPDRQFNFLVHLPDCKLINAKFVTTFLLLFFGQLALMFPQALWNIVANQGRVPEAASLRHVILIQAINDAMVKISKMHTGYDFSGKKPTKPRILDSPANVISTLTDCSCGLCNVEDNSTPFVPVILSQISLLDKITYKQTPAAEKIIHDHTSDVIHDRVEIEALEDRTKNEIAFPHLIIDDILQKGEGEEFEVFMEHPHSHDITDLPIASKEKITDMRSAIDLSHVPPHILDDMVKVLEKYEDCISVNTKSDWRPIKGFLAHVRFRDYKEFAQKLFTTSPSQVKLLTYMVDVLMQKGQIANCPCPAFVSNVFLVLKNSALKRERDEKENRENLEKQKYFEYKNLQPVVLHTKSNEVLPDLESKMSQPVDDSPFCVGEILAKNNPVLAENDSLLAKNNTFLAENNPKIKANEVFKEDHNFWTKDSKNQYKAQNAENKARQKSFPAKARPCRLGDEYHELRDKDILGEEQLAMLKDESSRWRIVYDLRAINARIITENNPKAVLGTMSILDQLPAPSGYKSSIDILACFPSVLLHPLCRKYFAFHFARANFSVPFCLLVLPTGIGKPSELGYMPVPNRKKWTPQGVREHVNYVGKVLERYFRLPCLSKRELTRYFGTF